MREVPVGRQGLVALVDDEDYDVAMQHTWGVVRSPQGVVYARRQWWEGEHRKAQKMHNFITGWPCVDHRDHDGLNNQRQNLRRATDSQNQANQRVRRTGSSEYRGVSWHRRRGDWGSRIRVDGRLIHLGYFTDEIEAARAYDSAARERFGDFACVNFADE